MWTGRLAHHVLALTLVIPAASATDIVVYHNWASPAELAALNVLREAVEARGNHWVPLAIPHDADGAITVLEVIDAGATPNVFLQSQPDIYRSLDAEGKLLHLGEQFAASGVLEQLPAVVREAITIDGAIVKVPATIHADAMIYYSRSVAEAAGIDPESWTSLDDMWADFDAVRAAGYQPIALGAQRWQVGYLTHVLVASLGGPEVYAGLYGRTVKPAVLDDASMLEVFVWLRRFQQLVDAEAVNRDWNIATNMVINGQALLQLQGDWMKGEWHAAGKTEGVDFGCRLVPGAIHLPVTVDSWGLLGGVSPEIEAAERAFADAIVDSTIQTRFAAAKGSTPVRLDAHVAINACSQKVLAALDRPDFALPTPHLTASPALVAAVWDVANRYWNDPLMPPAAAIAALKAAQAAVQPAR
ncbi:ABC transporter substrate-binding protein [Devosia sp.]|uniref:ABC transporter substrate-binding protein n=1 Tax=Devosia sp. TaxID=1871048 RepID=UPI002FCC4641